MSQWLHLNIYFKNCLETMTIMAGQTLPQTKPTGLYKKLISYLNEVVDSLTPKLVNRYFYFFEPNPHLFMALEAKDENKIDLMKKKITGVKKPSFISSVTIGRSSDDGNGEATINFFHAATKYAFFRIGNKYQPVYTKNNETKLIHCFCNQLFVNRENEIEFYKNSLEIWNKSIGKTK